ncbi:Eukaryotic translation initiation factor 2B, subunit 4 delta, 67kDa, partial [Clydaea vesicula]
MSEQINGPHQSNKSKKKIQTQNMTKAERRELQEKQRAEKNQKKQENTQLNLAQQKKTQQLASSVSSLDLNRTSQPNQLSASTPNIRKPPAQMRQDDPKMVKKIEKTQTVQRIPVQKPVALFSHLTQYEKPQSNLAQDIVHPSIISLGLKFSEFVIVGGNARCIAMIDVFKKVIHDYVTPPGSSLIRHLTMYLGKQIDYLTSARVLAASMKSAIRHLKSEISILSIDLPDIDAKEKLYDELDNFILKNITIADQYIVHQTLQNIHDGDVILTHARSSVVLAVFQAAYDMGIKFRVIVCDSRPKLEGKELLKRLVATGIPCTYILSNALGVVMKEVTKVIVGASALFSNGAVMSRAGTAVVAMMANEFQVPFIVCCETYKFSDVVRLDSFVWNEIGDSDELLDLTNSEPSSKLPSVVPTLTNMQSNASMIRRSEWRNLDSLGILNLHYDVTPSHLVTMCVCEIGIISSTSVVTVLRDLLEKKE